MEDAYAELTSRNWAFISTPEQERIRHARILLAGCGLGSTIASLACQTGFTRFTLCDHDIVEPSNLNRQAFDLTHVGQNKASALASILRSRNPELEIAVVPERVTADNAGRLVSSADLVVNTVDFDEVGYALNAAAREAGVPVLFPMNMGWGGFCMVFTPESATLEEMVGPEPPANDGEYIGRLLASTIGMHLPAYLARRLGELPEIVAAADRPAPQLGVAAHRSASLVVEAMVRLTLGLAVRTAPRPMLDDGWDEWST